MNKKNDIKICIIIIVSVIILTIISIFGATSGISGSSSYSSGNITRYKSIADLIDSTGFELDIPNIVYDNSDNIFDMYSIMGQIIEIDANNFVYKASILVSYNADILGFYDKAQEDYMYLVNSDDSDIKFFRYRLLYPEYEHCTIITWCTEETTNGLIYGDILSRDAILKELNITEDMLTKTSTEEILQMENNMEVSSNEVSSNINYKRYTIGNKFVIDIPEFASEVEVIDYNGIALFYIDKTLLFAIIYNDYDIDNNTLGGQSEAVLADGIVLRYRTENPFDHSHKDYSNYNRFIKTINNIKKTIVYL